MSNYEVKILDIGDIHLESSFLVLARNMGVLTTVPTFSFLIIGKDGDPVLVDTGYVNTEIMANVGMTGTQTEEQKLVNQLAKHGLKPKDVRWLLHTHLHIDHCGLDHIFPNTTTVVINRRELEYSASGLMGEQYPASYIKHLIDRLHVPGALRLLDLELSGPDEILPGIVCEAAGGHTEGSMNINVQTSEGVACICGDVIYDIQHQLVEPHYQVLELQPAPTGNHGTTKRQESAAAKKALNSGKFLLPVHDRPAQIQSGVVVARLHDVVPGPSTPVTQHSLTKQQVTA